MARSLIRRFDASAFSPRESYARATHTPREVRHLAEAALGWVIGNVVQDVESPLGNLPELFGFRPVRRSLTPERVPSSIALSDYTRLFVAPGALWCSSPDGSTHLAANQFEPLRVPFEVVPDRYLDLPMIAKRCATPLDWVLAWNHIAAALRQLGEYEAWVQRRGVGLRVDAERPKAARKTDVSVADLPGALNALAEWAGDGEQAMLAWIIADAKTRGADPELPERYRRRPLDRLLGLLRGRSSPMNDEAG